MTLTAPLLLLLAACSVSAGALSRNLLQFGQMISCYQPGVNPLKYNEYGCWCGLGGQGPPQDGVDRCCQVHDNCYGSVMDSSGCQNLTDLPYVIVYNFLCSSKKVTCSAANDACEAAVCECDRAAAECFARNQYNSENKSPASSVCV